MRHVKAMAAGTALALAGLLSTVASAAPPRMAVLNSAVVAESAVEKVDWRPYRHCHGRRGYRRCHGGVYFGGDGPGVQLYIGPSRRAHRHHRRRHH